MDWLDMPTLKGTDPELFSVIEKECARQHRKLELIASENFVSPSVLEAMGSVLTNKYAEGYPKKRYYGGCEYVDMSEQLAIDRVRTLFSAEAANVQPHSGSQANMAVYFSELQPGDVVLAMDLSHGGHLTHGSPVNFSGRFYKVVPYGVCRDTEQIDMAEVAKLAREHRPKLIMTGASNYSRTIDFAQFRQIASEIGAVLVADIAHIAGLVAKGLHPSPVGVCDYVTSTTHKTLRGPRGGLILCGADREKRLNSQIFPGIQGGPLCHVIAAKAVAFREALDPRFGDYSGQIIKNAQALSAALSRRGFRVVSGGTDNHLLSLDLSRSKIGKLTGKVAERALDHAGITVNKNMIPFDSESPFVTSGVRMGTPALTTRGMKEADMERIAGWIGAVLEAPEDTTIIDRVRQEVEGFAESFPLFAW